MQSTLDRKVIYLMLRGARRQEAGRRRKPVPAALPARLTEDGWWLNAPETAPASRATVAPRLVDTAKAAAKVTADE
jgi:hypothetical protein